MRPVGKQGNGRADEKHQVTRKLAPPAKERELLRRNLATATHHSGAQDGGEEDGGARLIRRPKARRDGQREAQGACDSMDAINLAVAQRW
jgi:hypothetical protein